MDEKVTSMEVTTDDAVDEPVVDLSSEKERTPSTTSEPEMLTKEQAEKLANERHSKLDKRISELEKSQEKSTRALEAAVRRAKGAEDNLALARKQTEEAERRALGDTPDALTLFEAKIAHKQAEGALEARIREHEDEKAEWMDTVAELKQYRITKLAEEIASNPKHKVDPALLVSMTDGTREKMEKLATVLPEMTTEDKVTNPEPPDSGRKSRVLTNPSVPQLEKMSMDEYARYVDERDKKKRSNLLGGK